MMDEETRKRARAFIYPLRVTQDAVWRFVKLHEPIENRAGAMAYKAHTAISAAESAARRFPIDPSGL